MVSLPGVQDDHASVTAERSGKDDPSIRGGGHQRAGIDGQRQPLRIMARTIRLAELAQDVARHGIIEFCLQLLEFVCGSNAVFVGHRLAGERPGLLPFRLALAAPFLFLGAGEGGGVAHRADLLFQAADQALEAGGAGGKLLGADFFPFGTQDFGPAFAKVKDAKPDIVWLILVAGDAVTAVKQYRSFDMKQPLVFHAWDDSMLGAVTAAEEAGILSTQAYYQSLDNPVNKAFVAAYEAQYKEYPGKYGAAGYNVTHIVAQAIERAKKATPDAIRAALEKTDYEGVNGRFLFDAKHQAYGFDEVLVRLEKGKPEVVVTTKVEKP